MHLPPTNMQVENPGLGMFWGAARTPSTRGGHCPLPQACMIAGKSRCFNLVLPYQQTPHLHSPSETRLRSHGLRWNPSPRRISVSRGHRRTSDVRSDAGDAGVEGRVIRAPVWEKPTGVAHPALVWGGMGATFWKSTLGEENAFLGAE